MFASETWVATTAFCERSWRSWWRFVLSVHYFDFWNWVYQQAYPQEFESSDRYDRWYTGRFQELMPRDMSGRNTGDIADRYAR